MEEQEAEPELEANCHSVIVIATQNKPDGGQHSRAVPQLLQSATDSSYSIKSSCLCLGTLLESVKTHQNFGRVVISTCSGLSEELNSMYFSTGQETKTDGSFISLMDRKGIQLKSQELN